MEYAISFWEYLSCLIGFLFVTILFISLRVQDVLLRQCLRAGWTKAERYFTSFVAGLSFFLVFLISGQSLAETARNLSIGVGLLIIVLMIFLCLTFCELITRIIVWCYNPEIEFDKWPFLRSYSSEAIEKWAPLVPGLTGLRGYSTVVHSQAETMSISTGTSPLLLKVNVCRRFSPFLTVPKSTSRSSNTITGSPCKLFNP